MNYNYKDYKKWYKKDYQPIKFKTLGIINLTINFNIYKYF